ncbi:MAG: sulfur oxidation c-type cytochrome SoxA [Pseudomonadota bacterium]
MGYVAVDRGQEFIELLSKKNPEFLSCLSEGKNNLASIATRYPKYNARLKRIMTIESQIEYCSQSVFGQKIKGGSNESNMITMYIKSLSTGEPLQVNTGSRPLMAAYRRGEKLFYTKAGQFNYACASCHTPQGGAMGKHLRGQTPTTVFGDAAQYPVYHTKLGLISMA